MALPVENERELAVGGFQGIKKIRGLLIGIDVQDPPENWERTNDRQVVKVETEETVVLEMFGDEEPMELKDGKFAFYIPYVEAGKSPHQNSIYSRCWLASAKELGHKPSEFIGQYVTLEKQARLLFETRLGKEFITEEGFVLNKKGDRVENVEVVLDENNQQDIKKDKVLVRIFAKNEQGLPNHFCFVADETADADNVKEYIRELVSGLNQKAALRKLLIDPKAKQFPEMKERLNAGTLAEYLELVVVDDKFTKPEEEVK